MERFLKFILVFALIAATCWAGDLQVIAHRGFSSVAPENTMAAFQAAAELGVAFELDVTLTADGEVVVIHDDTLGRTTNGRGAVGDVSLAEIKELDAGSWFGAEYAGEKIPTLREVLERFGGVVPIDIEIKDRKPHEPLADAVVAEIERLGLVNEVFVTAFNPYMLVRTREKNPELRRGMLTGTFKDENLSLPEKFVLRRLLLQRKVKPRYIAIEDVRVNRRNVRRWQRRGYAVLVWTVNDEAEMQRMIGLGVDGIITDYPDRLLQLLGRENEK